MSVILSGYRGGLAEVGDGDRLAAEFGAFVGGEDDLEALQRFREAGGRVGMVGTCCVASHSFVGHGAACSYRSFGGKALPRFRLRQGGSVALRQGISRSW